MERSRWKCTAALAVSALVAAIAPPATAETESALRVAITSDVESLNPFVATSLVATQIGRLMYEFLTVNGADDSSPEPGLADTWETSNDNLTWTFHIREGMRWSDGQPITAKDVEFTYNKIMTDESAAGANGVAVTNYDSVKAVNENTVVIRTKQPQASMLQSEIPVVPWHAWKDVTDYKKFANDKFPVIGSGPFVLTGYQEGQSVTLEANGNFWRGRPKIDKLQFVKYESTDAAVQGLHKGDVDLVYRLTAVQYKALQGRSNIMTNAGTSRRFVEIILNPSNAKADGGTYGNGNPALKDVKFRTALAYAIDVNTIVDKIKQGLAEPATEVIPSAFPDWTFRPAEAQKHRFDLVKANSLLDEAGYVKAGNDIRTDKHGNEINLRLLATSDNSDNQQISEYIKAWFKEIGILVTVQYKSSSQLDDDTSAGNYDLAFSGWSVSPDPDFMLAQETCDVVGTDLSDSNFCSADYDKLYHQQQVELDKSKRIELVQRAQSILYDNVSAIVLTYDKQLEAYRADRYHPFKTQPADRGIIANQSGYWSYYYANPVAADQTRGDNRSVGSTGMIVGIGAAIATIFIGLMWAFRRRRADVDKRE